MKRSARINIDLDALTHNLSIVSNTAPRSKIIAVIKANAYGHGMLPIARHLENKVHALAVACVDEALLLRDAGITADLVILQGFHDTQQLEQCLQFKLQPVCHQQWQLDLFKSVDSEQVIDVWLKVDTGMNRLGLPVQRAMSAWHELQKLASVNNIRIMSHFACADELQSDMNNQQLAIFRQITAQVTAEASMANSAAIMTLSDAHFDWVRPGIMLYGVSPFAEPDPLLNLKPVMTVSSHLIAIKEIRQGDSVGYGCSWTAPQDGLIGVVAIGYGDGYPRHAANGTPVLVNNQRCAVVGRVSMDMITVDLSGLKDQAKVGDQVVLWGDGLGVEEIAQHADTIPYELLCAMGREQ